ncbi:class II aldolase/adducin family protein [Chloroflexota bacterium]
MQRINWNDEWSIRKEMCRVGKRLYDLFLIAGNDGNISVKLPTDELLITPTGVSKGFLEPEDMIKTTMDGAIISANEGYKMSSEYRMHLIVYAHRPDVNSVVHAHPPTATGFSVAGMSLEEPFLPEVVVRTGPTPLVPYTIPGGDELPESLVPYLEGTGALLMGNHGVVAFSESLWEALWNLETVELNAKVFLTAKQLGNVNYLTSEDVQALETRYDIKK